MQRTREKKSNGRTLIIGCSLLRNIDKNKLVNTDVIYLSAAKVADVTTDLKSVIHDKEHKYEHVITLCGGNNCAIPDPQIESITTTIRSLFRLLVQPLWRSRFAAYRGWSPYMQQKPYVASMPPSSPWDQIWMCPLPTCTTYSISKNGDINDGYLVDNIHLTLKGTDAMVQRLDIAMRQGSSIASMQNPKQTVPGTWTKVVNMPSSQPNVLSHPPGGSLRNVQDANGISYGLCQCESKGMSQEKPRQCAVAWPWGSC